MITQAELALAIHCIQADDWDAAHEIAQIHSDPTANWLHAILHKIEGDVGNSHYWYAKTNGIRYEQYAVLADELLAIQAS